MLAGVAVIVGAIFLWELLCGLGLIAWGLVELIRQLLFGSR